MDVSPRPLIWGFPSHARLGEGSNPKAGQPLSFSCPSLPGSRLLV